MTPSKSRGQCRRLLVADVRQLSASDSEVAIHVPWSAAQVVVVDVDDAKLISCSFPTAP